MIKGSEFSWRFSWMVYFRCLNSSLMIKPFAKIFFAFIFFAAISSCEKRNCNNVVCPAGQACNSGKCFCADGFEGTDCQTQSFEKYVASSRYWNVSESCGNTPPNFSNSTCFFLHNSANPSEIEIVNMFNGNCNAIAYIRTDQSNQGNILEIPTQNCGGITVSGQGTYRTSNFAEIILELNYTWNGNSFQCTHTFR